jgi:hypothetical protein
MKRWLNISLLLVVAAFSLYCTGDLIRKSDQSAILAGANDLVQGRVSDWGQYYQFDKTYVVYWVCAAFVWVKSAVAENASLIACCNVGIAGLFWAALAGFVVRFRDKLSPVVLLCCVTSPAILLNTMYVNSTACSSAFLLLSMVLLFSRHSWTAAFLFFLAVGSRADVILLLPLILWLITPFPMLGTFFGAFSKGWKPGVCGLALFSKHWKLIAAGLIALVLGPVLGGGSGVSLDPFFNIKMVAGYTVFGFGAAGLLFVWMASRLLLNGVRSRDIWQRLFAAVGLVAFLLPVLFFLPQLHAPRYFWRGCEAMLLVAVSGCLPSARLPVRRVVSAILCVAAVVPLFVGIQMPQLGHPRPVFSAPEQFPSGDGHYPMGAYLAFMRQLRNADEIPVDHNQRVWKALRSADFDGTPDQTLLVLYTPMSGHFMLEASLRGRKIYRCGKDRMPADVPFYADSRSLMRMDPKGDGPAGAGLLNMAARPVSISVEGVEIIQFRLGDFQWGRQTALLNRLHGGNEYLIIPAGSAVKPGRHIVYFSETPFPFAQRDPESGLYYTEDDVSQSEGQLAVSVLPLWMSMQAFSGQ